MKTHLICAIAQLNFKLGAIDENTNALIKAHQQAATQQADIILVPEMYLSGYQLDDLVLVDGFMDAINAAIAKLAKLTVDNAPAMIVGAPRREGNSLYNSVYVLDGGVVVATRDKVRLPIGGVFDDPRNFANGVMPDPVVIGGISMGLPILRIYGTPMLSGISVKKGRILFCHQMDHPLKLIKPICEYRPRWRVLLKI